MKEFHYENNDLWCENVPVSTIAEQFGTPLYLYSRSSIVDHCRHIERSFGEIDHLSCYAVKANANREILRLLASEGIGADVGSSGELHLALEAGFLPSYITYSGVGKRDDEIIYALRENIQSFNVESEEEIEVINTLASGLRTVAKILLRVNFDIEAGTHKYVTTGKKHNKFGVEVERATGILVRARKMPAIQVVGIHSHLGSQITDPRAFVSAAEAVLGLVGELRAEGIGLTQVNFGGGFGVQYHDFIDHPYLPPAEQHAEHGLSTAALLNAALPILQRTNCRILIQPGRSIVAHAGILVTKVLYRKEVDGKTFIIVDAGMNDLIRPSLYQSYHQIVPLSLKESTHEMVDVVGPLCETGDFLALDRMLPQTQRNDLLALMCAGAYGYALSSNYNARPRPAEVLVEGAQARLIRPRESLDQL